MKFILWMLILFWAAIFVLNLRALHTIQEWLLSVKSSYIMMLLPGAMLGAVGGAASKGIRAFVE